MLIPANIIPHNSLITPAIISKEPVVNLPYRMDIYWVLKDVIDILRPTLEIELELENISNNIGIQIVNFNSDTKSFLRYPLGDGDNRYIIYINNYAIIKQYDLYAIIHACILELCWQYALIHYHFNTLYPGDGCIPSEYEYEDNGNANYVASQIISTMYTGRLPLVYYSSIIYSKYSTKYANHGTMFDFVRWIHILTDEYDIDTWTCIQVAHSLSILHYHDEVEFIHHYYPPECNDTYYDIQYRDDKYYIEYNCNVPPMYIKEDVLEYTTELILYSIMDVFRLSLDCDIKRTLILENIMVVDSLYMSLYHRLEEIYNKTYKL